MKIKLFVAREIQYFEHGIFSFNSYVYYLTRGFIASTCAFNLLTRAFSLLTRAFCVLTPEFELATREFELVTRGFELVTCGFELVTRGFELVTRGFELATRGFELVTRVLLFYLQTLLPNKKNPSKLKKNYLPTASGSIISPTIIAQSTNSFAEENNLCNVVSTMLGQHCVKILSSQCCPNRS